MTRLHYSEKSLEDLDAILTFIAGDKPDAAIRFVESIIAASESFVEHPYLGMARDDLAENLRLFVHRGYGIYYRHQILDNEVLIERVLHSALDGSQQRFD